MGATGHGHRSEGSRRFLAVAGSSSKKFKESNSLCWEMWGAKGIEIESLKTQNSKSTPGRNSNRRREGKGGRGERRILGF